MCREGSFVPPISRKPDKDNGKETFRLLENAFLHELMVEESMRDGDTYEFWVY